jgi:LysM repeat protein
MARRSPTRWLAPLALVGALGAMLLVINSSGGSGTGSTAASSPSAITGSATTPTAATTTTTTSAGTSRFYAVKPGDVLSAIAESTGVPLSQIEQLNPGIDAQTLHAGQKIQLVP